MKAIQFSAAFLILAMNFARAEIYTEYTKGTFSNPGSMVTPTRSQFGMVVNIANIATTTMPLTDLKAASYLLIDKNLDANGNGVMYLNYGELRIQDFSFLLPMGFAGSVVATGSNVTFTFYSGPIVVNHNQFTINNMTEGLMAINAGTLTIDGNLLGQDVHTIADFSVFPIVKDFSQLTSPVVGYTDASPSGSDTDTDPHTGGNLSGGYPEPWITGLSNIDTDGAETFINYNGLSIQTSITLGSTVLPTTLTLTGNVTVSVPELGSVLLVGATSSGFGLLWLRRG